MDQSASKSLHFLNYKKNDISETNSRRLGGLLALGITGSVIVGLYAVVFPFVSPALRKICLPFVPATNAQVQNVMTALRRIRRRTTNENVIDLGSGDGRLVIEAAKLGHFAEGAELNIWLVWYARWNAWRQGVSSNTRFFKRNLWDVNLANYNNIIIFGVQEMMDDLERKALKELEPSGCVIACRFPFPNWRPAATFGSGIDTVWLYNKKIANALPK